jgi:phosphoribosylaminoimidazolecarboxamide formyltransferase/IMP cyclohydrolase
MSSNKRALISVSDKSGIIELAQSLINSGYKIIASDGSAAYLESNQIPVTRIEEVTGSPELFGGRVKSLHPLIHGAILFDREDPKQVQEAVTSGIEAIDVVVINLYHPDKFDIGGPALIRAAAKNHK